MASEKLILQGAEVIDPAQGIHEVADVAFADGKVVEIGQGLSLEGARVEDVSGLMVVPGLVDIHAHFFYGVNSLSRDPRTDFLPTGTTCAVDAGSSGSVNFLNFREFIIEPAPLDLYAFLNITPLGLTTARYLELDDYEMAKDKGERLEKAIRRHAERVVGIKVVLPSPGMVGYDNSEALIQLAVEVAAAADTRVMVHIDGGLPLETLCGHLRSGDIITHCYQGNTPTTVDAGAAIEEAVERGVVLDVAPAGASHFSWEVAEACAERGIWANTISSDYASVPRNAPPGFMRPLPEVMSTMLQLGMPLDEVVRATTATPAAAIGLADAHGSLRPGAAGNAAVFRQGDEMLECGDMQGNTRSVPNAFEPVATVVDGAIAWSAREGGEQA